MTIIIQLVLLVIGFAALVKGADFFVEGSSAVAGQLKVPGVVIGLTIVAMGTSAPELAVSVSAAIAGSNEIAISNIIGSDIFNLVLIFAICAVITPVTVDRGIMKRISVFNYYFCDTGSHDCRLCILQGRRSLLRMVYCFQEQLAD